MSNNTSRTLAARAFVGLSLYGLGLVACTEDNAAALLCGGHGEFRGDHCDCEPGYTRSDDMLTCIGEHDTAWEQDAMQVEVSGTIDPSDAGAGDAGDAGAGDANAFEFNASEARAATGQAGDGSQVWVLSSAGDAALLNLELYEPVGGPLTPGAFAIEAADTDYARCTTCIILQTGCATHGDHFHCATTLMPVAGGELHLDEIGSAPGDRLAGEMSDITFREVTIGSDFQTQTVADGAELHLEFWSFDAELENIEGSALCGGHGHMDGDHCHCDSGYRVDPEDSTNCISE